MKKVLSLCLAAALALSLAACKNEPESYPVEVVGPERTSAPVPTADPEASASPQPGWVVAPRTDIDIQKSLADYAKPQATQLAQQDQLAFFLQNDKIGVIDLDGTVRIPAEKDVHWCDVCGITNSDESEIYEQDGTVVREPVQSVRLECIVHNPILTDGPTWDCAAVSLRAIDQNGSLLPYCGEAVQLSVDGPLKIIGPSVVPLRGGMAGTYLATTGEAGRAVLHCRMEGALDTDAVVTIRCREA